MFVLNIIGSGVFYIYEVK